MWVFTINPQLCSQVGSMLLSLFEETEEVTTLSQTNHQVYFTTYHADV